MQSTKFNQCIFFVSHLITIPPSLPDIYCISVKTFAYSACRMKVFFIYNVYIFFRIFYLLLTIKNYFLNYFVCKILREKSFFFPCKVKHLKTNYRITYVFSEGSEAFKHLGTSTSLDLFSFLNKELRFIILI